MIEPTRLCCDCKYYKKDWFEHLTSGRDRFDTCSNPTLSGNLVTGKVKKGNFCDVLREPYGRCGEEGKYWEANHPSYCCPKCGKQIGWLGRFFNFFIPNYHRCKND